MGKMGERERGREEREEIGRQEVGVYYSGDSKWFMSMAGTLDKDQTSLLLHTQLCG